MIPRLLLLLALLFSGPAFSATYDLGKVGPTSWARPGLATFAYSAASAFRTLSGPISAFLTIGSVVQSITPFMADNTSPIRFTPKPVAPPGWPAADSPPPTSPVCYYRMGYSNQDCYNSADAACKQFTTIKGIYGSGSTCYDETGTPRASVGTKCPPGYTGNPSNGVQCSLSTPSSVTWLNDLITDIVPKNQQLIPFPTFETDPLPTYSSDPITTTTKQGDTWKRQGTDTYGNPVSESITATIDGGLDWQRKTQITSPDGSSLTQTDAVHVTSTGLVTDVSSRTAPGTLTTTAPAPVSTTSTITSTMPAPTTQDRPVAVLAPVATPTPFVDPATDASPAPASSPLPYVAPGKKPVDEPGKNKAPPAGSCDCSIELKAPKAPSFEDSMRQFWNGLNASSIAQSLQFSVPDGSCPALNIAFSGVYAAMGPLHTTVYCDVLEQLRPVIGFAFLAAYCVTAIFIVLDA